MAREVGKDIAIEIVKNKDLSKRQKETINNARKKEFGKNEVKDFSKNYEPRTLWFFIKDKNKVVSFAGIIPIKVKYNRKTYNIGGICSTISLVKKSGYGRVMVHALIDYSKKKGKTIVGFTGETKFFAKVGLGTKKNFIPDNKTLLEENGFEFKDSGGDNKRLFFKKEDEKVGWIHVHLVKLNKIVWNDQILFRDFLKSNPKERDYYAKIKAEAAEDAKGDGERYKKYKEECIEFIINKAKNSLNH